MALAVLAPMLLLAGCGLTHSVPGEPGQPGEAAAPAMAGQSTVVAAQYPQCDVGPVILRYLETGDNQGQPQLDLLFADRVGVPAPEARAIASQYIADCDEQLAADAARAAETTTTAAARASAAEQQEAVTAQEQSGCEDIGGRYADRRCYSAMTDNPDCVLFGASQWLDFLDGRINPESYQIAQDALPDCWY
jgi:hypothetical protein